MRMRTTALLTAIFALTLLLPAGTATAAPKARVLVGDNFFKPAKRTIRRGTLVRFRWIGRNPHNVVKRRGPGRRFRSRTTTRRRVNFAKRFRRRGNYLLLCTIHPREMRLRLRVR